MSDHSEPMDPAEVLARAVAFDPLLETAPFGLGIPFQPTASSAANQQNRIMRLALEMIVAQCDSYEAGGYDLVTRIQRTAEQALRECESL